MTTDRTARMDALIAWLEDDIRMCEQSRAIYMSPKERSHRIRERQAWIADIRELVTHHAQTQEAAHPQEG